MSVTNAELKALRRGINLGNGWMIQLIPVEKLFVDATYQRDEKSIDNIKGDGDFKEDALGVLEVGLRKKGVKGGGKHWVTDGQHRLKAVKWRLDKGLAAPDELRCLVKLNTTQKEEAEMFCNKNSGKPVTGNSRFKAMLVYGHNPEAMINEWVEAAGFHLIFRSAGRPTTVDQEGTGIYSPVTLQKIYNKCTDHIQLALQFVRTLYSGDCVPYTVRNGAVIGGIALFFKDSPDKDAERVALRFKKMFLDLPGGIEDCKEADGNCRNQQGLAKEIAHWLGDVLGNGYAKQIRKAA